MKTIKLSVDCEVQGYNKEISDVEKLKEAVVKELDNDVGEVQIKKRAPERDSSQKCGKFVVFREYLFFGFQFGQCIIKTPEKPRK